MWVVTQKLKHITPKVLADQQNVLAIIHQAEVYSGGYLLNREARR